MIEWLFILSTAIFAICFVIGVMASMYYEEEVDKKFKNYNTIVNIMTWSVFAIIPTGILTIVLKILS